MDTGSKIMIVAALLVLSILAYTFEKRIKAEYRMISSDFEIYSSGKIIDFDGYAYTTEYNSEYRYQDNAGNAYTNATTKKNPCNYKGSIYAKREIMDQSYPVIYSAADPSISRLLVRPQDFEKFGLGFPDSLRYIYKKYWDCD